MTKKAEKKTAKTYYTVGVRFLYTKTMPVVYTYKVAARVNVHLGQELVADTPHGSSIVVVVRIDKARQDIEPGIAYKFLTRKVAPI